MADFYNPYQFIPVTGKINGKPTPTVAFQAIKTGHHPTRHDAWQDSRFSGRFVCALHLQTPTLVGGIHQPATPTTPAIVHTYEVDSQPAIPGNSLRGMVGAVAEALSQSALRVLQDETYSLRKQMQAGESLSAIGMIQRETDAQGDDKYFILPLCMANMELPSKIPDKWQNTFKHDSLRMCMGAYVNGYFHGNAGASYTGFLGKHRPSCYHPQKQQFFYAKLSKELDRVGVADISKNLRDLYIKNERFVLGQRIIDDVILSAPEFIALVDRQASDQDKARVKQDYVRGFLYVLGIEGRKAEIPHTKRHERFIPYPETRKKFKKIPIPKDVLETFQKIAKQRAYASEKDDVVLPFLPEGYSFDEFKENGYKPLKGDLMYFDFEKIDGLDQVIEISYSAIWRKAIKGTVHQAFANIQTQHNLVPWGCPERNALTPVETLFGVVTDRKLTDKLESQNLASRLRFYDAKPLAELRKLPTTLLKALSSPKPPSPCLYFHSNNPQQPVNKSNLNLEKGIPNGRKVYIPHPKAQIDRRDWETSDATDRPRLKMQCEPIDSGQSLYFHIDFENLDAAELTLIKTALRPDSGFLHRLGLGKPLGLGAVQLEIIGEFYIDRVKRYSVEGLSASRYAKLTRHATSWPEELATRYPLEAAMFANAEIVSTPSPEDERYIDQQTKAIMIQLGNVDTYDPTIPVRYPFAQSQQASGETELFKWFGNNEKAVGQNYQSLSKVTSGLRLKGMRRN